MKNYFYVLSLITILFEASFYFGCAPVSTSVKPEILSSERLVDKLEVNRRRIRSFDGTGSLVINSGGVENKALFKIILVKPDSIQLSIMGPFGIELGDAIVTNNHYIFYDALQNTAYEGEVNENILKNIFRIDLPFSDLMDAFLGAVNMTNHLYKKPTTYTVDNDKYILTFADSLSQKIETYKVDIRQLGITDFDIKSFSGDQLFTGSYSDFTLIENLAVPYLININDKQDDQTLSIKYKSIITNKPYIHTDFSIPHDANVIKW